MWPSSHLAIGYLLYTSYSHARLRRSPSEFAAVLVLLGTQLPDLIDKPLALVGVLPSGRALGHSLLFGLPVIAIVGAVVYRRRGEITPSVAFGVSYLSALFFDGAQQFIQGALVTDIREVSFWIWPLTPPAERIVERLTVTPTVEYVVANKASWTAANLPTGEDLKTLIRLFEVTVTAVAIGVWLFDGAPGLRTFRETVSWARGTIGGDEGK
ncbi:LexA-binding, inner membrane-associated putative hydrolase [Halopelagius inordinatus]|uniref:LexA-binding, inner membrane-associated putative hydrolase n=1 Tax=Halopelagius inordinatus TaxID=553467 RepID=A0A1I2UDF9_9EURY|nr:metal-dependent hydrolase [Halopelagius inordinatus]SFG72721.1 LexA-binding, inner membrane-associated putative hydrolase [Halopelagius inordinatus]